jgi:D-alanyl-D-alanine carboxypeptidase
MLRFNVFSLIGPFLGLLLIFTTSCNKENGFLPKDIQNNQKVFDMDLFQQNLQAGMGNQWTGYAFAISQHGQLKRSGTLGKRLNATDGNIDMETTTPLYGASVNKVMTAVAMLRILEEKGNGDAGFWLNATIAQFLPPGWNFGPNSANITFRNLLQHRSGIPSSAPIDYQGLRALIATGTAVNKNYEYSNANYALLRILVARMSGNVTGIDNNDQVNASAVLAGFRRYMETVIFDPLDIKAETSPAGNWAAKYYGWGLSAPGWTIGDMTGRLGNGGFYFSAIDCAKFLAYLNHSEQIVNANTREIMYNQYLGWSDGNDPQNEPKGEYGTYYYKNGSFCNNVDNGNCSGQGVRNIVATYPHNKVEVTIMANSRGGNMDSSSALRAMLRNAYDNAWVKK